MKFVCENCKAKYQIGDEKVAGKTLRMKCRRCGHMIQVSATVTESSVSQLNPTLAQPDASSSAPAPRSPVPAAPAAPRPPSPSPPDDDSATVVRPSPLFLRSLGSSAVPPPARPSATKVAPPAPPRASGPGASGLGVPGPLAARAAAMASRGPASSPGASNGPASSPISENVGGGSSALTGGFSRAVAGAPSVPHDAPPTDDWYVGVGGVPLGPVRLSVIREKASAGAVDGESLVWREGFEEWQPLKTFPALLSLVDEARSSRASRPLLTPVPPQGTPGPLAARSSVVPAAPRPPTKSPPPAQNGTAAQNGLAAGLTTDTHGGAASPSFQNGALSAPPAAVSVPFSLVSPASGVSALDVEGSRPSSPPRISGLPPEPSLDAFGKVDPQRADMLDPLAPQIATALRNGTALGGVSTDAMARPSYMPPASTSMPAKRRGVHPIAWAFVAMCAAFGGVAAWAVFLRKPETVIITNTVPGAPTQVGGINGAAPPAPPTDMPTGGVAPQSTGGSVAMNGSQGTQVGPGTSKIAKPDSTGGTPGGSDINRDGFGLTPGGPNVGPDTSNGGSHGQLSQGEIEGVVTRNKPGITRRCWEPAWDARDSGAGKSAKVSVSLTVGPTGSVSGSQASGGEHFPGLASCIASSVKAWQFPPSDGSTPVNIPFSFNKQ